jgi:hypothetical protein
MRNPKGSGNRSTEPYRVLENASQTQKGSETDIQTQKGSNLKESGTRNAEPERVWKPERGTLQGSGKRKTKTRKTTGDGQNYAPPQDERHKPEHNRRLKTPWTPLF